MSGIVGIDLSFTATGIATDTVGDAIIRFPRAKGLARLILIRDAVLDLCGGARLAVIEGYSFNSRQGGEHLGELGGVVRVALWEAGVPFVDVAPALVKKFATGKGNAPKDAVLAAAVRAGFDGDDNNAADAWWLRQIGVYRFGDPVLWRRSTARDEVAAKIEWPEWQEAVA